jgi:hypothetical protein
MRRETRFFLNDEAPMKLMDFAGVTLLGQPLNGHSILFFALFFQSFSLSGFVCPALYTTLVSALSPTGIRSTISSSATENPLSLTCGLFNTSFLLGCCVGGIGCWKGHWGYLRQPGPKRHLRHRNSNVKRKEMNIKYIRSSAYQLRIPNSCIARMKEMAAWSSATVSIATWCRILLLRCSMSQRMYVRTLWVSTIRPVSAIRFRFFGF